MMGGVTIMANQLAIQIAKLERQEAKLIGAEKQYGVMKQALYEKLPEKVRQTLEAAFEKAFSLIFQKGTGIIEKTFRKEDLALEFDINNYSIDRKQSKKHIRKLDSTAKKTGRINDTVVTASGLGMGLLGMGIPEIPFFVGMLLKGIYETAGSYGFDYQREEEQVYLLRLIRVALTDGAEQLRHNQELEQGAIYTTVEEEIRLTAKVLADAMLLEKVIQGTPIIGVFGAVANHAAYRRVARMSQLKYKKRYLKAKLLV